MTVHVIYVQSPLSKCSAVYKTQVFLARGVCRASRYDGWWSPDTIATELRSHDRRDKNARPATRGACCPGSHGRQSPIKPDFEPGSVSWSNHKSIYLPFRAGMIKKFRYRDIRPLNIRDTPIYPCSRVLKIDNIACAIAVYNFRKVQLKTRKGTIKPELPRKDSRN